MEIRNIIKGVRLKERSHEGALWLIVDMGDGLRRPLLKIPVPTSRAGYMGRDIDRLPYAYKRTDIGGLVDSVPR